MTGRLQTTMVWQCCVPMCMSSCKTTPYKMFFHLPGNENRRKQWLSAMRRNPREGGTCKPLVVCEDHFNLREDLSNYFNVKYAPNMTKPVLKKTVIPHQFNCQLWRDVSEVPTLNIKGEPMSSRNANINDLEEFDGAMQKNTKYLDISPLCMNDENSNDSDIHSIGDGINFVVPVIPEGAMCYIYPSNIDHSNKSVEEEKTRGNHREDLNTEDSGESVSSDVVSWPASPGEADSSVQMKSNSSTSFEFPSCEVIVNENEPAIASSSSMSLMSSCMNTAVIHPDESRDNMCVTSTCISGDEGNDCGGDDAHSVCSVWSSSTTCMKHQQSSSQPSVSEVVTCTEDIVKTTQIVEGKWNNFSRTGSSFVITPIEKEKISRQKRDNLTKEKEARVREYIQQLYIPANKRPPAQNEQTSHITKSEETKHKVHTSVRKQKRVNMNYRAQKSKKQKRENKPALHSINFFEEKHSLGMSQADLYKSSLKHGCTLSLKKLESDLSQVNKTFFVCPVCCEVFVDRLSVCSHGLDSKTTTRLKCSLCSMLFFSKCALYWHMTDHGSARFTCDLCAEGFSNTIHKDKHLLQHVSPVLWNSGSTMGYMCFVCFNTYTSYGTLLSHANMHRMVGKCAICCKYFARNEIYLKEEHMKTHTCAK